MGTIIGDYIGATIGIHSPVPYSAPGSNVHGVGWAEQDSQEPILGPEFKTL